MDEWGENSLKGVGSSYRNQPHLLKNSYLGNNIWICRVNNCCSSVEEEHREQSFISEAISSLLFKNFLLSSKKFKF